MLLILDDIAAIRYTLILRYMPPCRRYVTPPARLYFMLSAPPLLDISRQRVADYMADYYFATLLPAMLPDDATMLILYVDAIQERCCALRYGMSALIYADAAERATICYYLRYA